MAASVKQRLRQFYNSVTTGRVATPSIVVTEGFGGIRGPTLSPAKRKKGVASLATPVFLLPEISADGYWRGFFNVRFAQELRRFFWRRGIDIESRAPFESRRFG